MKTNLFFLYFLIFGFVALNAQQTIIFEDDFESYDDFIIENVGDWTIVNADGSSDDTGFADVTFPNQEIAHAFIVFNPFQTTPPIDDITDYDWDFSPASGEKYMLAKFSYDGPSSDWLISPQIQLTNDPGLTIEFAAKAPSGFFPNETYKVWVSTTDKELSSFTEVATGMMVLAKEWVTISFSLDDYAGQSVYLAIEYTSDNLFAFLVDDFKVYSETTAGTSELNLKNLKIYPNPVQSEFSLVYPDGKLNEKTLQIKISDLNGQTVKTFGSSAVYNVSGLEKGVYILEANDGKTIFRTKMIKN